MRLARRLPTPASAPPFALPTSPGPLTFRKGSKFSSLREIADTTAFKFLPELTAQVAFLAFSVLQYAVELQ
jgi:hypothetical protein